MRAKDVMTSPVVTVTPDTPLKSVASLLVERGINAVPVVDRAGRLCGIVSEADLLSLEGGVVAGSRGELPHAAREVMSSSVYTVTEDTEATAAARMMLRHGLKSLPVVAGDQVVGIIARRDLLRLITRSDEDIRADLERRLEEQVAALQKVRVEVVDGVATVTAPGPLSRQLVESLAGAVPGVVEVRATTTGPAPEPGGGPAR
jgi:CBS domain-containing protein